MLAGDTAPDSLAVRSRSSGARTRWKMSWKLNVPMYVHRIIRPTMKPASPTRLVMNALFAAVARRLPLVVEADQEERADADQFPD